MMRLPVCLMLIGLSGCASTSHAPADAWCLSNSPRRYTDAELAAMGEQQSLEAVAYNKLGMSRCGWGTK
jgi:hypothetical protein